MPRNITVTFGDGTSHVYQNAPDDITPQAVQARAQQEFGKEVTGLDGGRGAAPVAQATPESSVLQDLGRGFVQGSKDLGAGLARGAGSIGATLLAPVDAAARAMGVQNDYIGRTDRRQAMDEALQGMGANPNSLSYGAGKLATEVAGTAGMGGALARGAATVPRVSAPLVEALRSGGMTTGAARAPGFANALRDMGTRAAGGAATAGASAGLVNPDDADSGVAVGGLLPGAMRLAQGVGRSIGSLGAVDQNIRPIARVATEKYGIPLGMGDVSQNGLVKGLRSIMNDAPITGAIGQAQQQAKQDAFNQAVGRTFGADAAKLTPDVVDAAKGRMGAEFDRLWNRNSLVVDESMLGRMKELRTVSAKMPKSEGASLAAEIDDLASKMQAGPNGEKIIPGDVANKFQSYLRRRAEGSAGMKNELGDLRQEIIGAFNRSVSPEDAAALTLNRSQYKAYKTLEPLLNKGDVGVGGRLPGDVPASLLPSAVAQKYSRAGATDLGELSQIGSQFLVDRTPKTGGSARAALQNTAIGAALMGGGMTNPMLALSAVPAAIGAQKLLGSPALARRALSSQDAALINYLRQSQDQLGPMAAKVAPLLVTD